MSTDSLMGRYLRYVVESHTFYQSDVDHSESNRGCDIYLIMSLLPIAALVRTNEGPYRPRSHVYFCVLWT